MCSGRTPTDSRHVELLKAHASRDVRPGAVGVVGEDRNAGSDVRLSDRTERLSFDERQLRRVRVLADLTERPKAPVAPPRGTSSSAIWSSLFVARSAGYVRSM